MPDKIIYVVTSGDYSDYSISCIFEDIEDAEEYIKRTEDNSEKRTHETCMKVYDEFKKKGMNPDKHTDPRENCPTCIKLRKWDWGHYRIEEYELIPKGVIPAMIGE